MQTTTTDIHYFFSFHLTQVSTSSSSDSSSDEEEDDDEKKPTLTVVGDTPGDLAAATTTMVAPKPVNKNDRGKCKICNGLQRCNRRNKPEIFVRCSICQRDGMQTQYVMRNHSRTILLADTNEKKNKNKKKTLNAFIIDFQLIPVV